MTDIRYTDAQIAAIEHEGGALLISASAGSGKTKVLVLRLMRKIMGPSAPDIDRFLIITYTKAAAAELRAKISEELSGLLRLHPRSRHLRRQISLIYQAQIATIHSFCAAILREYAHVLDIRSDFRVLDASEGRILQQDVLEDLLEKRYEEMRGSFRLLVDTMSAGRDDSALCRIILDTYTALQSHPYPEKWLRKEIGRPMLSGDAGKTVWGKFLLNKAGRNVDSLIKKLENTVKLMSFDSKVEKAYLQSFLCTIQSLYSLSDAIEKGWDEAHRFGTVDFPRLSPLRGYTEDETVIKIKEIRKSVKTSADRLCEVFETGSTELTEDLNEVRPAVDELFSIVLDFGNAFFAEKRKRGFLDFSDLEHLAIALLIDPETGAPTGIAEEIAARYHEILVDEYQDVNRVQDMIFTAVSKKGRNITMVGDVKQSIYRFRLADPTIFLEKYERFADNPEEGGPRRILLSKNFRSRAGILDAVNHLFAGIMSKELGEMDYTPREYLQTGAQYDTPDENPFELCVLEHGTLDTGVDRIGIEANYIAARIKQMANSGMCVTDGDISRPVGYGDIVILLRSLKDKEEVYINALKQAGIPAAAQKAVSIFENPEISLLLSLLTVIDNPMQDVPLIAVLRSPLVGFTADELAEIRACDLSADFYTALGKMAARSEKCAAFLKRLKDFRDRAADFATDRLLRYLYDETGLPGIAAAESPGAASRLLLLLDYARQFEEKGYKGLFSFITHLNDLAEQDDLPLKISGSGSGQEVLITSIHSSKGLEYPVVFLADLSKKFNKEDTKKPLLIHRDLGAGPKKLDTRRRIEYPTLARLGIAAKIAEESLSEEMRVLYVGMTRAREKLITVLSLKDAEDKLRKLSCFAEYPLSPQTLENCESLGDWLLLAALDQRESIVICRPETQCAGEAEAEENAAIVPSLELIDQLRMKLRYTYPHQNAAMLPSKLTATELKGDFFTEEAAENAEKVISAATETVFRRPRFTMEEKGLTSAERGTALHLVMQYIDFQRCGDLEGIASEIRRLGEARMITPEQRDAVRTEPIHRFLQSPLGQRVRNAKALNREFKFSLLTPARDILPEGGEDQVLLQGVVDLCMENGNGLTVVDFKTDDVTQATQKDRAEAYRGQLKAYALAMERIFGAPVTERLVYFFTTGTAVAL